MFDEKVLDAIRQKMLEQKESLAVAESVTAGFLAGAFSTAKDASLFFQGGITTYNLGQKSRHLKVDPIHAQHCNCVSEPVACAMATEVTGLFAAGYGIGVTGYSTITPDVNDRLYANYAITHAHTIIDSGEITSNKEEGFPAQLDFVNQLLAIFLQQL